MTRKSISYFSLTVRGVGVALGCISWGVWAQPSRGQLPLPVEEVESQPSIEKKLTIKAIVVEGSTAFSSQEIESITKPYINKTAIFREIEADILQIIAAINELYQERGYVASGAYFPQQDLSQGVIRLQVVEGELEDVKVTKLKRLDSSYVRDRLFLAGESPLNANRLSAALRRLQESPLIETIRAQLEAGTAPNTRVLEVEVEEAPALRVGAAFDNYQSFVVGENQGTATLEHLNLFGLGDRAVVQYNKTEGLEQVYVGYTIPLNARDGTLSLRYSSGNSKVITEPFERFDLTTESQEASVIWRQPVIQEPNINNEEWGTLSVYPFLDFAAIGNNFFPTFSPDAVASVGLGLEWNWRDALRIRLDYANSLVDVQGEQNFLFSVQFTGRL